MLVTFLSHTCAIAKGGTPYHINIAQIKFIFTVGIGLLVQNLAQVCGVFNEKTG